MASPYKTREQAESADNNIVDIPAAGVADRTQLTGVANLYAVTLQAAHGNAGRIYVGGASVTNSAGARRGIGLDPGDAFGPIEVSNLNALYVAADNAGDDVIWFGV